MSDLFSIPEWYVLESYIPENPTHRPKYQVVDRAGLEATKRPVGIRAKRQGRYRLCWRICGGIHPTQAAAEDFLSVQRGLRSLEAPALFAPRPPAPIVTMPCGCIVSRDKRREKRCAEANEFKEGVVAMRLEWLENDSKWLELQHLRRLYDGHLEDAQKELDEKVKASQ